MKYIFEHFNEITFRDDVCGWAFDDLGEFVSGGEDCSEFRPLDNEQMNDLYEAGKVTFENVVATRKARQKSVEQTIAKYIDAMANRTEEQIAEQRAEARAAFGSGEKVVNMLTGETWIT